MTNRQISLYTGFSVVLSIYVWMDGLRRFHFEPHQWKSLLLFLFCLGTYLSMILVITVVLRNLNSIAAVEVEKLRNPWKQLVTLFVVIVGISIGIVIAQLAGPPLLNDLSKNRYAREDFIANVQFSPFMAIALSILIMFVNSVYRAVQGSKISRYLYYVVVILVAAVLSLDNLGQNSSLQTWYFYLLKTRGERRLVKPDVVIIHMDERTEKARFLKPLSFIDSCRPKLIGIIPGFFVVLDSSIVQAVKNAQLAIGTYASDSAWLNYHEKRFPRVIFGSLRFPWQERELYQIFYPQYDGPLSNLGVALASSFLSREPKIVRDDNEPTLINYYYSYDPWQRKTFRSIKFELRSDSKVLWNVGVESPQSWFYYSSFTFDETGGGLQKTSFSREEPEKVLDDLTGKIVLIDFNEKDLSWNQVFSSADRYAAIIQNIVSNNFLVTPPRFLQLCTLLIWIGCIAFIYFRFQVWRASAFVAFLLAGLGAAAVMLYVELEILFSFLPFVIAVCSCMLFLVPFELLTERRRLLEERARLSTELQTARDMQMGLMPKEDPVVKGFDVSGACIPASEVGGDFYDYVWLDKKQTKLGVALADVSGKAMKAAMTAVMTSGMLYSEALKSKSPREILARINRPLYLRSDRRVFTALSFAVVDTKSKKLTYSSAGQSQPILIRNGLLSYLKTEGVRLPLGIKEELKYRDFNLKLRSKDTVVFYTDGVPEAMNTESKFYGFERFEELLRQHQALGAKELRDKIVENVQVFAGKTEQPDDMTVVVVKVN